MSQINDANSLSNRSDAAGRFSPAERADRSRRNDIASTRPPIVAPAPARNGRAADSVQLSAAATKPAESLSVERSPERAAKIEHIRSEIEAGRYPSDDLLDTALDRLVSDYQRWTGRA